MASATWRPVSVATTTRSAEASTAGPDESSSQWMAGPPAVGSRRAQGATGRARGHVGAEEREDPGVPLPDRPAAADDDTRSLRQAVDLVSLGHDSTLSRAAPIRAFARPDSVARELSLAVRLVAGLS